MLGGCGVFGVCGEVGLGSSTSRGRGLIVGPLVWLGRTVLEQYCIVARSR